MPNAFDGVKIFSATTIAQRQTIDEDVTHWLKQKRRNPKFQLVDIVVRQSSDEAFHCLTYSIFFKETA